MDTNHLGPSQGNRTVGESMNHFLQRLALSVAIVLFSPLIICGMVFIVWSES
jgi:hypothetical protein